MATVDLGNVVGPQGPAGTAGKDGKQGERGPAGPSATINGYPAINLVAGDSVELKQDDSIFTISARVSNLNILDDWYFVDPINQRRKTEYTTTGYTIDRWSNEGPGKTISVLENGIFLESGAILTQKIEEHILQAINNRTITCSMLLSDGTLHSGSLIFDKSKSSPQTFVKRDTFALYFTGSHWLQCYDVGKNMTISAMKLELGPVQTLAYKEGDKWVLNDPPPNKALELAKCQRYFQTFATENLRPTKGADFRPPMRTDTPTLSTITLPGGTTLYTASSDL